MAFFYRSLNCWVVSRLLKFHLPIIGHPRGYVPKQLLPCRIPADISTDIFSMGSLARLSHVVADYCPFWVLPKFSRGESRMKYAAELFGTFVLVFAGLTTAVIAGGKVGNVGVAMAFGLSLLAMAFAVG